MKKSKQIKKAQITLRELFEQEEKFKHSVVGKWIIVRSYDEYKAWQVKDYSEIDFYCNLNLIRDTTSFIKKFRSTEKEAWKLFKKELQQKHLKTCEQYQKDVQFVDEKIKGK